MREQQLLRHGEAELTAGRQRELDRGERVATELEEVVGDAHRFEPQDVLPELHQEPLGVGLGQLDRERRGAVHPVGRRQGRGVELAVGGVGQFVDVDERRRDRRGRQPVGEEASQLRRRRQFDRVRGRLDPRGEHGARPRLVPDLAEHALHVVEVELVVELLHRLGARLVAEAHVPRVGHRVVVVALLGLVGVDARRVHEAVGRASGVGRSHPRRSGREEVEHVRELDVDVAVEVDEGDPVEHVVGGEHRRVEQPVRRIGHAVVAAPCLDDGAVDRVGIEPLAVELAGHQARLEQLAAAETGDEQRGADLVGHLHAERVDRLVAAVAHVRVPLEAVAEDRVHVLGRHEVVLDAEIGHRPADVLPSRPRR